MGKFNYEQDKLLVTLVRAQECLWNSKHPHNKNNFKREKVWRTIGKSLNKPGLEVKSRWRTIRDNYMRKNQSSSAKKRAVYWSMCQFLDGNVSEPNSSTDDHVSPRSEYEKDDSNDENISEQNSFGEVFLPLSVEMNHEVNDSNDITIENGMEVIDNVFQENYYEAPVADDVNLECPPTKQHKDGRAASLMQYLADTEEDKKQFKKFLQDVMKSTSQEDEVDVFFKSMAMTVKKLRPDLITKAKTKVFQTVMEFEVLNQKS